MLEFSTYRWLEHCGPNYDNDLGYRTEDEYLDWRAKEPIAGFSASLLSSGVLSEAGLSQMDQLISDETDAAFRFADASPFPDAAAAYSDLYCDSGSQPELQLGS